MTNVEIPERTLITASSCPGLKEVCPIFLRADHTEEGVAIQTLIIFIDYNKEVDSFSIK